MSNGNGAVKIEYVDPASLRNDPELDRLWPLEPEGEPSEAAFIDDVAARGVLDPLKVSPDGRFVWDGRRRLRAAKRNPERIRTVMVERFPAKDRLAVIMDSLMHRRHLSESARIYLTYDFWAAILKSFKRVKNLRKPLSESEEANDPSGEVGLSGLAVKWGVDRKNFQRCRTVSKLFAEHPDVRDEWEPKLLSGKASFWNILSGYKGLLAGKTHAGQAPGQFRAPAVRQWFGAVKTIGVRLKDFESLTEKDKRAIRAELHRDFLERRKKLTAEDLEAIAKASQYVTAEYSALAEEARKKEEEE